MPAAVPGIWSTRRTLLDAARGGSARLLPAVGIAARAATVTNPSAASSRFVPWRLSLMTFPLFVAHTACRAMYVSVLTRPTFFEPACEGGRDPDLLRLLFSVRPRSRPRLRRTLHCS